MLKRFHSSSICPVSQISRSMTAGIPCFCGRPKILFLLKPFFWPVTINCFLRLPVEVNFLYHGGYIIVSSFGMPFASIVKPWKGLFVWVTTEMNIPLKILVNGQTIHLLNYKKILEASHPKELFYLYLWKDDIIQSSFFFLTSNFRRSYQIWRRVRSVGIHNSTHRDLDWLIRGVFFPPLIL